MKRLRALLRQPEFPAILFFFGMLAFIRPVFLMLSAAPAPVVMRSVYLPWILITVLLIFIGRTLSSAPVSQGSARGEEVSDD